jgi:Fe-coproporphyrin III synthase
LEVLVLRVKNLLNLSGDKLYTLPLLVMYITDGCNSRCATCDIWRNPRRNMSLKLAQELADTAQEIGMRWVLISGGEAMQHPEWHTIARMFKDKGVRVMMLTNGLLVKKQIAQLDGAIDDLIVSLDGATPEMYEVIRGVDALDLVLEGMKLASELTTVSTRTTVQQRNYQQIPQIVDVALANGASSVSFLAIDVSNPYAFGDRQLTTPEGALSVQDIPQLEQVLTSLERDYAWAFEQGKIAESPQKLRRILLEYFKALHGTSQFAPPRCNAPHMSTVVEVDGTLRPCYFLPAYGRLKPDGESLSQALNVPAAQALRQAYRTGQRAECAKCVCPLYKSPRELLKM